MARRFSTALFDLVKTMTIKEQDFFHDYAMYEGDNKYVQLFDLLVKQEIYNEAILKEKLYGIKKQGNQFPVLKRYLYDEVLKSLSIYHTQDARYVYFQERLQSLEWLIQKGLLEAASCLLNDLNNSAIEEEWFMILATIDKYQYYLAYTILSSRKYDHSFLSARYNSLDVLQDIEKHRLLFSEIFLKMKKTAIVRDAALQADIESIIQQVVLLKSNSYEQELLYGLIESYGLYIVQDFQQLYLRSKALYKQIEQYPSIVEQDVLYTIAVLNNWITSCNLSNRYEESLVLLEKLNKLSDIPNNRIDLIKRMYYLNHLAIYNQMGLFQKAVPLIGQITKNIQDAANTINILFGFAYTYIGMADYHGALVWLNKITAMGKESLRVDLQSVARMLILIAYYELKQQDLLEYSIVNYTRFLKKNKRYFEFERFFIRFMKALMNTTNALNTIKDYYEAFKILLNDGNDKVIMVDYFDFNTWFISKVEHKALAVVQQEQYQMKKAQIGHSK